MLDFVVTGMPRSSTKWVSEALTSVGLPCTHETACSDWNRRDFSDDGVWLTAEGGESSWQAAPFTKTMRAEGVKVIHLVRDPIAVTASVIANGMMDLDPDGNHYPFQDFVAHHVGGDFLRRNSPYDGALLLWTRWNWLIDADHVWTVPVGTAQILEAFPELSPEASVTAAGLAPVNGKAEVPRISPGDFDPILWRHALDLWRRLLRR